MPLFTDMLGREVLLKDVPKRIVSLVPSQTELLSDLGLEEEVVGITKFCIHPEKWFRSKARIGGTKQVHTDRIAALQPDLIIANKEENVREQIEALEAIAPVWVSDITNLEEALQMIAGIGAICHKQVAAQSMIAEIKQGFASFPAPSILKIKVAYGIWRKPWMWAGGDTFIDDMISRIGWGNALKDIPRYPEMDLASLVAFDPELVLLSSEPYPFKEQHIQEVKAVLPQAKVLLVDGEYFSWYGSRLMHAVPYFKTLISENL